MEGDDTEGYEYCYTPDNSQKNWRLHTSALPRMDEGRGKGNLDSKSGFGGKVGITGGDWSTDGIRRYHTGGSISIEPPPQHTGSGGGNTSINGDGGEQSPNILRVGTMDVNVGVMNGVELSPAKKSMEKEKEAVGENDDIESEAESEGKFSIDDGEDAPDGTRNYPDANSRPDLKEEVKDLTEGKVQDNTECLQEGDDTNPTLADDVFTTEDASPTTISSNQNTPISHPPSGKSKHVESSTSINTNMFDSGLFSSNQFTNTTSTINTMTTFESLYHLSPSMAWRLRSAYAPTTPQEEHFMSVGSEILAQRHPDKADGIMRGLAVARQCESRVCDGLRKIGELISYCERIKGRNISSSSTVRRVADEDKSFGDKDDEEDVNDEDIQAAEAMFDYFCEKNVLPMLIDSLLCHPPALSSSDTILNAVSLINNSSMSSTDSSSHHSSSPFSGVNWTASVKSQILQTIAMILFNTSSPLSLTYLLSNNYMNELIMGMMPLDRWRADALEEILPPYVTLLRGLAMRLRGDEGKYCLPLFLCQRQRRNTLTNVNGNSNDNITAVATTETYLPLLYAAVQVFCSSYGTSLRDSEGCLIRTTAMNVILNLARISDPEMNLVLVVGGGDAINGSALPATKSTPFPSPASAALSAVSSPLTLEQELLFPHICNCLK